MERLIKIKDQLIDQVQSQMGDLKCVNTKELGEVIDMIKDLAKAIYYCEVYEQMEEAQQSRKMEATNNYYYTEKYIPYESQYNRDVDRWYGRMYYPEGSDASFHSATSAPGTPDGHFTDPSNASGGSNRGYYTERDYPIYLRDEREGRSPIKRKMYMESKATNQDSSKAMKDLEGYLQDLTADVMELLDKASADEKAMVQKKMNTLATKVQNV